MTTLLVRLVEDGEVLAEQLHKVHWRESILTVFDSFHHGASCHCENVVGCRVCDLRWCFHILKCFVKFVDSLEALDHRVQVACVSQIVQTGCDSDSLLLVESLGTLLRRHVLEKLDWLLWLHEHLLLCRAHHHDCCTFFEACKFG